MPLWVSSSAEMGPAAVYAVSLRGPAGVTVQNDFSNPFMPDAPSMNSGLKRLVWPRPLGLCSARMYPRFFNAESAVIAVRFVMPASLAILTMLGSRLFAHEMESAHATRIVAPGSVLSCNTRLSQMYDIMVRPAVKGVPRSTYSPSW